MTTRALIAVAAATAILAGAGTGSAASTPVGPSPRAGMPGLVPTLPPERAPRFRDGVVRMHGLCLPDLVVRGIEYRSEERRYYATFANWGCADAGSFSVRLLDGLHRIRGLAAGASVVRSSACRPGDHATAEVDVLDEVVESDEGGSGGLFC